MQPLVELVHELGCDILYLNITETSTAFPGNTSIRPLTVTPVAQVLRMNGYSTAHFGKCHETPAWEVNVSGPFDHWPTLSGMDKFYGFMGAEGDQFKPELYDGLAMQPTVTDPNYHLSEDLADKCIAWMREQKAVTPDKPFFTYFAPGATHAPHQVPAQYRDKFKGQFDEGWDVIRARTLENMKKMGICPPNTELTAKPRGIMDWDTLDETHKKVFRRQMELYAAFAWHVDQQIGRVFDALEEMELMDDTIIYYILGDNGASAEGNLPGMFNEVVAHNGLAEAFDFVLSKLDDFGSDAAYNTYSACWAIALDSPFMYCKEVASDFGGTRNAMIFHCPARYQANGEVHSQFHHVIDVAPTILDLCGVPQPTHVNGVAQRPMEGISMRYCLEDKNAEGRRKTQYFSTLSCYAIYHDGWFAAKTGHLPWFAKPGDNWPAEGIEYLDWTLFHQAEDFSLAHDVAGKYPEKLEELKRVFNDEALKYNVLPIETRSYNLVNAELVGRPTVMGKRKEITLHAGMQGLRENAFLNTKNHSFSIVADVDVGKGHTDGVVFTQGNRFGGFVLYVKNGVPNFCYNWFGMDHYYARGTKPLEYGKNQLRMEFAYDGGGLGKGGTASLFVNHEKVGEVRIDKTMPMMISVDGGVSCGLQRQSPVTDEYTLEESYFKGDIYGVTVKVTD